MNRQINQTMGGREWLMLLTLGLVWGGSFFFNAILLQYLPVLTIVFLRLSIAALFLWLVVFALRLPLPRDGKSWWLLFVLGVLNNAVPFCLIVWGQSAISSSLASILNATTPFFTLITAHYLTSDEPIRLNRLAGLIIGFTGVAVMVGITAFSGLWSNIIGQLAILGAAFSYGFASVHGRKLSYQPPLVTAAGQTTCSSLTLLPFILFIDQPWQLNMPSFSVWLSVLALAIPCTAFAYYLFFSILKSAGAANVSLVTFLVPASAIMLGTLVLGDLLAPRHIIGGIAIACGLALIDGRILRLLKALFKPASSA